VYCLESADQPGPESLFDAELVAGRQPFQEKFEGDLLGGLVVLRHAGAVAEKAFEEDPLYANLPMHDVMPPVRPFKSVDLTFIPYYAWANRGMTSMEVWVPLDQAGSGRR